MLYTFYVALATFWAWETVRFTVSEYAARAYSASRAAHPLVVAVLPLVVFWPDWVRALAVAGLVGIFHLIATRFMDAGSVQELPAPRRQRQINLPTLP